MSLRKAVKDVLDVLDEDGFIGTNTDGSLVEALRTAYAEPYVPMPDLDDIAYRCDSNGDWVVDLHEARAIVERLTKPYVPMTDDEWCKWLDGGIPSGLSYSFYKELEAHILARLGIEARA